MPDYRRARVAGRTYFFTVVTYRRQRFLCDDDVRGWLRAGIEKTRQRYPFDIDAWVLLPDHLHCIWSLPPGDADYAKRWAMIKQCVTKHCPRLKNDAWLNDSQRKRNESTLWQRRFWEHQIRNERDFMNHVDYIHYNPVKHGLVQRVTDWPWSTFHRYVDEGVCARDWGGNAETIAHGGAGE